MYNEFKILWFSDVHATGKSPKSRTDIYPNTIKEKLIEIGDIANREKANVIVCGGDLFHTPIVALNYGGEIARIIKSWNKPVLVVPGNHDIFSYSTSTLNNTMLGMLASTGIISIFTRKNPISIDVCGNKVILEAQEYFADIDDSPSSYNKTVQGDLNILFAHGMLQAKAILDTIKHVVVDAIPDPADITFCGHDHAGWGCIEVNNKFFINNGSIGRVDKSASMKKHEPSVCILTIENNGSNDLLPNVINIPLQCVKNFDDVFDNTTSMQTSSTNEFISFVNMVSGINLSNGNNPVSYINEMETKGVINKTIKDKSIGYIDNSQKTVGAKNINHYTKLQNNIYISKLTMKDFMSHKSSTVDFIDGVNVISGENNTGKSTIMRAINWICNDNPKGNEMIRTGSSSCEVKLEFSNGTYIRKTRTKTKASYFVFDGVQEIKYEGYGTKPPVEILNTHQMPLINLYKDKDISLNYADQMNGLFLIDCNSSEKSEAIGKLTGADVIDNAISVSSSDMTKAKKEYKVKVSESQEVDAAIIAKRQQVDTLKQINIEAKAIMTFIQCADEIDTYLKELNQDIKQVNLDKARYDSVTERYFTVSDVCDVLLSWNIDKYDECLDIVFELMNTLSDKVKFNSNKKKIDKIIKSEPIIDGFNTEVLDTISELITTTSINSTLVQKLYGLESVADIDIQCSDYKDIADIISDINSSIDDNARLDIVSGTKDNAIANIENKEIINIDKAIQKIEDELHRNGICEMCNRPLDEESVNYILSR